MRTPLVYEDLLGKPYLHGGRGPEAFDCAGLLIEMQRRRGFVLTVPETPDTEQGSHLATRRILRGQWVELPAALPGCAVFFPGDAHVGMMLNSRQFLHTSSELGECCVESLEDFAWRRKERLFYVPEPL